MGYRVAIDVGGTFTDLIAVHLQTGEVVTTKTPTTPAFADGFVESLVASGIPSHEIEVIVHGSTVGTNAVIERKGPKVGLLCTSGFRDLLEVRREWRETLYDLNWKKPQSLIPRRHRCEVVERMDSQGRVVTPLDEDSVRQSVEYLKSQGIGSYAVSLLWSFVNPTHERRVAELIGEVHPRAAVSLSVDVNPQVKEYERTSSTVVDAFLKPIMTSYIEDIKQRLRGLEIRAPLWFMKANGGVMTAEAAQARTLDTLSSGPAGGVTACMHLGRRLQLPNLITFDMGGTSTDVCLIHNEFPLYINERDLEWNIPVRMPMMEIVSIGAGGGSIGWTDQGGALQLGPRSAGAYPGPACYMRGGQEPTVTDANLVLGRLNPDYFLGGTMQVDPGAATAALGRLGSLFGWDGQQCAVAIHKLSVAKMAQLLREVTVVRGFDPRDFSLVSFGGAGGIVAAEIAEEAQIPEVICPTNAGVYSAAGSLFADMVLEYVRTFLAQIMTADLDTLQGHIELLQSAAKHELRISRIEDEPTYEVYLDLRYVGEIYEITTRLESVSRGGLADAANAFHDLHRQFYGFDRPEEAVELVNVRLRASLPTPKPELGRPAGNGSGGAQKEVRPVYFQRTNGYVNTPIIERYKLEAGATIDGPAIIEEPQTTIVVPPGHSALVDEIGNIVLRHKAV